MEFFQEPTFTAFVALILSLLIAKIVSFAVSVSTSDGNGGVCYVTEGPVAQQSTVNRGLKVKTTKSKKKVTFVADVQVRNIDRFETENGSPKNLEKIGSNEVIVEEKNPNEETIQRVDDQFGDKNSGVEISKEQGFDEGSEIIEMLIEKKIEIDELGGPLGVKEEKSENFEEQNDVVLKSIVDEEKGNEVFMEEKVRDDESSSVDSEDDEGWEGIERSELEKVFAEAVNYVEYGGKGKDKESFQLDSDVQNQLYGLHKVAVEGPCHGPQPMALKVSARAKWNAWQQLGSMSPEMAMEQYIRLLSDSIPGWIHDFSAEDDIKDCSTTEVTGALRSQLRCFPESERKVELNVIDTGDFSTALSSVEKGSIE